MISIKTTALIMAVSSILGVAPMAAAAQSGDQTQGAAINDPDTNTQVNSAVQTLTQRNADDSNTLTAAAAQSNILDDTDVNTLVQNIGQ
jgi:hypothetical protein